jgi:dethiobiotin synthetase
MISRFTGEQIRFIFFRSVSRFAGKIRRISQGANSNPQCYKFSHMRAKKIIFITGTDTGVGKTLLTALLLHHLRETGIQALAMKPFCSGGRDDVRLLQSLQPGELTDAEANPFYFEKPVAPLVALKKLHRDIPLKTVITRIQHVKKKCDMLLVEGSGGLMVPLGKGYFISDVISKLDCQVIVVARNQLGTINHTILTTNALQSLGIKRKNLSIALMTSGKPDASSPTNREILSECLPAISISEIPHLGRGLIRSEAIKSRDKNVKTFMEKLLNHPIS